MLRCRGLWLVAGVVAWSVSFGSEAGANSPVQNDPPGETKPASPHASQGPSLQPETPEQPAEPKSESSWDTLAVELAPLIGVDEDAQTPAGVAKAVDRAIQQAQAARDPAETADLLHVAANVILARQVEPACSRALLGLSKSPDGPDAPAALLQADALLEDAAAAIQRVRAGPTPDPDWLDDALRRQEVLEAFSAAITAFLEPKASDEVRGRLRRAASGLSPLLEDEDRAVSASAAMWNAYLRSRAMDPDRVLPLLELGLSDPDPGTMPYGFFARLLRCRLIADRGGFGASLALLVQMEERCGRWFGRSADRKDAVRAIALAELSILRAWREQLEEPAGERARRWCLRRAGELRADYFPDDAGTVLRLKEAIPILIPAPNTDEQDAG